jgi:hypothetical protein
LEAHADGEEWLDLCCLGGKRVSTLLLSTDEELSTCKNLLQDIKIRDNAKVYSLSPTSTQVLNSDIY